MTDQQAPNDDYFTGTFADEPPEYPDIPADIYDAIVDDIEPWEGTDYTTKEPRAEFLWRFAISVDGEATTVPGWTKVVWTDPRANLWQWTEAVLGKGSLPGPVNLKTDVVGGTCRVQVGHSESGKPRVKAVFPPAKK